MPSSREPVVVTPDRAWTLVELRDGGPAPAPAPAAFERAAEHRPRPAVFEVSPVSGIPDELLAPARRAAQSAGYAAGWASGVRAARAITDAEAHRAATDREHAASVQAHAVARAVTALDFAAVALERQAVPAAEQLEELIISSALAIAEALVGQVLRNDAVRSQAALSRALALAPVGEDVTVALSPADYAVLAADTLASKGSSRTIAFCEDATLAPGDAVASCGATRIDARLAAGLDRVREVLRV